MLIWTVAVGMAIAGNAGAAVSGMRLPTATALLNAGNVSAAVTKSRVGARFWTVAPAGEVRDMRLPPSRVSEQPLLPMVVSAGNVPAASIGIRADDRVSIAAAPLNDREGL